MSVFSPDAIDLSLCATTVSESEHNQAEADGISEQMRISIIHYHRQENDNDKFLNWYGEYFSFSGSQMSSGIIGESLSMAEK